MRLLLRTLPSAVLLAALGFAIARLAHKHTAPPPTPLTQSAAGAGFVVSYPGAWTPRPDLAAKAPLTNSVALAPHRPQNAQLLIALAHPASPGGLAPGLRGTLARVPAPKVVRLGAMSFYRYLGAAPKGMAVSEAVYTLPTSTGTLTGICSAPGGTVAFTSTCERVLATVRLTSGRALSLTVSTDYAFQLNRILTHLGAVRSSAAAGLRSSNPKIIAAAASKLAAADASAAAQARHITGSGVSAANDQLADALDMAARAYGGLTGAANALDTAGYQRAQASIVRAAAALDAAYAQLRRFGYRVS